MGPAIEARTGDRRVHAPVAELNEQLGPAVDGFFDRLRSERSFWRLGWGILDTADGYTPLDGTAAPRPTIPTLDDLHVRVERETCDGFPRTNAVLFTIRTYVAPILVAADDRDVARRLADSLSALPDDVRGYKDLRTTADALISALRGTPGET